MQARAVTGILPETARLDWVDMLRGGAILFVVIGHGWRGLHGAGVIDDAQLVGLDRAIYSFHMPLFFMISGFFYIRSLTLPAGAFVSARMRRLLYPMVLWTYVFVLAKLAAGPFVNTPVDWGDLWALPIPGRWHFWFLWALLLIHLALYGLRLLQTRPHLRTPVLLALLVVSIVGAQLTYLLPAGSWPWVGSAIVMLPYFVVGLLLGDILGRIPQRGLWPAIATLAFVTGFACAMAFPLGTYLPGLVVAMALCLFAVGASAGGGALPLPLQQGLSAMGRASMAIFLLHTFFSAALREVLLILGMTGVGLHIFLGVLIGVAGPMAAFYLAQRYHLTRALGF